jgi:hypothetical protein
MRIRIGKIPKVVLLSAVFGMVWGAIALMLGASLRPVIWGGVFLAPFIGVGAGFASVLFPAEGRFRRALFSLVSLYVAAAIFGLGIGVYDLATGQNVGDGWQRIPSAVVLQGAAATLWGLTFTGYFILLWPLSHANHSILSRLWREEAPRRY